MKIYLVEVLISLLFCIEPTLLENIEMRRFIGLDETWKSVKDFFYIPQTLCDQGDSSYEQYCSSHHICKRQDTVTDNRYLCSCPLENATLTYRDNLWRCRENVEVRRHFGCEINNIFRRVDETEPLRVISKNRWRRTELNKEECYISPDISWYIGCDGKRETLKPDQTSFKLRWNTGNPQAYFLTVLDDSYQGQIIKLGIRCTSKLQAYNNSCLLFKVQGKFSCPLGKQLANRLSSRTAAFSETTPNPSKGRFQPSSGVTQTDDSSFQLSVIGGVTASIIFTIVLLVVAFLICRRYKSRKRHNQESYTKNSSTSTATDRAVDEVTESPNDNSNVDGDHEHTYAGLRTEKREEAIYSSTYSVPQSPAVVDASGSYPHPNSAKEQIKKYQGNIEERFYDDVISLKCEPASENNEFAVLLFKQVDEVTESPDDNTNVDGDYEHAYAVLRTDKREEAIYSSTYSVLQSPAVADASGSYPHPDTAKEQIKNCQGNTEESFYDDVISLKCEPASENNEPIDNELTVVKITEESCYTGSAQLKDVNITQSSGRICYEIYPERPEGTPRD